MGRIKRGILGGFHGTVGTVVGASWKGIDYMRSKAESIKNPRTRGQVTQRNRFATTLQFLQPITSYIRIGFRPYAVKQTGFNAAMAYNIKNAIVGEYPNFELDYSKALVSRGTLTPVEGANANVTSSGVTFFWRDNSGTGNALLTDMAMPLLFNKDKEEAVFSTAGGKRFEEETTLTVPADWTGSKVEAYLGFISADGKSVATSIYLGKVTID
ncbi:MAG: hypothetical protein J5588_07690 [Bacteroidales bacterium]|nr:hypothetical protein [Bacteroidales bacterium]